ncbi:aspartate aminotransferase family protein [Rhizorhabdus histidinilytica]|jgi:glutamate-1-semialdehyde 2,1-aminomutase|uniref:Glutamate-1-semialdehyde 2,1-aminomutase n=1 Tax=Rhizorhabdus histidinilytica TaxID=439228 RepID=A0A1T5EQJ0_9SPHN|nr:aminotransferase class III-fold pyridoxal phosphate-dependent enzyme [Rhizorhabdus histidinilytica]SKB86175.1 glutamate-1-semialdehyde 2,1-aminomutase [Rhizorhabdus histidinilytica]
MSTVTRRSGPAIHDRSGVIGYSLSGAFYLPPQETIAIERGEGVRLIDTDGNAYIDLLAGSGAVLLGHGNAEIAAAIAEQARKGTHFYVLNERAIELGETLRRIIPCAEEIKFLPSGSEASMNAFRMCRAFTGKQKIMKFEGSFHGTNDYAMMSGWSQSPGYPVPSVDSLGIPDAIRDLVYVVPWNDLETTEKYLRAHAHEVAALICEPVQRTVPPVPGFLEAIRRITAELGILLVFDEMVTGWRMALGGAQEFYDVTPDVAIFGKAMTNGLPMTCIAGRADVIAGSRPAGAPAIGSRVFFGGTLNGNPLCAAAALQAIAIYARPGGHAHLRHIVGQLKQGIARSAARYGVPVQVVGPDSFFQIFFSETPVDSFAAQQASDSRLGYAFFRACLDRGLMMNSNARCYVPMVMTEAEADAALAIMDDAFAAVAALG